MCSKVFHIVSLAVVLHCVFIVANNTSETSQTPAKNSTDLFFAEGGGLSLAETSSTHATKSRIKGRKGAVLDNATEPIESNSSNESANLTSSSTIAASSATTNATTKATSNLIENTTLAPKPSPTTTTTTTLPTTTKKVPRKPKFTISADESPEIRKSEKNINYNTTTRLEDVVTPKTSSDIDRTILEEKRTRRNYIIYMGLAFSLPVAFILIHMTVKKVRNWMEIRHYQRVVSWDVKAGFIFPCFDSIGNGSFPWGIELNSLLSILGLPRWWNVHQLRKDSVMLRSDLVP